MQRNVFGWTIPLVLAATGTLTSVVCGDILAHIPADARAAIVVPHMKRTSDDITHLLETMELGAAMFGGRPIDQVKALAGFHTAINDHGGMAFIVPRDNDPRASSFAVVALVPVTDADQFLEANFTAEGDTWRHASGTVLHAADLGDMVALSIEPTALAAYQRRGGETLADALADRLGERGAALLAESDMTLFGDRDSMRFAIEMWRQQAQALRAMGVQVGGLDPMAMIESMAGSADDMRIGMVAIDIDPLGVIARTFAIAEPGTDTAQMFAGGPKGRDGLAHLPGKPFYIAGSIDVAGLGGATAFRRLADHGALPALPDWVSASRQLQFAVYPSIAGLRGGLLNDAMLRFETDRPAQALDAFEQFVRARADSDPGFTRTVQWESDRDVRDVGRAAAYEVRTTGAPPEMTMQMSFMPYIFGPSGWRGFATTTNDAMLMTFSQRPAVLADALKYADGAEPGLAGDPVISAMRRWMPDQPDIEIYIGVGQIATFALQLAQTMGMGDIAENLGLDGSIEPIAMAMHVGDGQAETTLILPARVLAVFARLGMQQSMQFQANEP